MLKDKSLTKEKIIYILYIFEKKILVLNENAINNSIYNNK